MKKKDLMRFAYLAAAIIVLAAVLFYANMKERGAESRREATLQPFFTTKPADAGYVLIKQGERVVELTKQDDKWFVLFAGTQFPAAEQDVQDLLDYFFGLKPESVVDEGEKTFGNYNVDDVNAVAVRIFAKKGEAKPLVDMLMGKSGSDYYSIYARRPGDNKVYLIASNQATLWSREASLWRDKYPLRENRDDINSVTITSKEGAFTLKRGEDGFWAFADNAKEKVNQELTVSLLSRLTGLVGLNLIDKVTPEMLLDKPEFTFELGVGARKVALIVSPVINEKRYVRNSELGQAFDIAASAFQGIKTLRQDYVKTGEAAGNTSAEGAEQNLPAGTPSAPLLPKNPEPPAGK